MNSTTTTCITCGAGLTSDKSPRCWHCRRDSGETTTVATATVTGHEGVAIAPGAELLHFNPSTGRIVRIVRAVEVRGDAVIVEAVNGKNRGEHYPVSSDALAAV